MNKTINNLFLAGTVALSGMGLLSACSSDDAPGNGEEPGGVAGQTVKTQFALNIPYGNVSTRMTENNTQGENKNFLGIQRLQLLTFGESPEANASLTATGSIRIGSGDDAYSKDQWRSVYRDVQIPVGTTDFILYGRAARLTDSKADYGYLSVPGNYESMTGLSNVKFQLERIAPSADFSTAGQGVIDALNKVANTSVKVTVGEGDGATEKTVSWADVENSELGTESERKVLAERYTQFVSMTAGSSKSALALVTGLRDFFDTDFDKQSKPLTAKLVENAKEAIDALGKIDFPGSVGLPDGVARIHFDQDVNSFAYESMASFGEKNSIDYTKITYPAALAYYVCSPAMTSTKELTGYAGLPDYDDWTGGTADWSASSFEKKPVSQQTRSVALEKALQYAVANLKLSVKCSSSTLEDNAKDKGGYKENQQVEVKNSGFPVKAILVGGQPSEVAWNFEAPSGDGFDYTIYDTKMNVDANGSFAAQYNPATTQWNYTLVLDNNNCETKQNVYVTVELENNAGDFYGKDGLVPKNGKFYLVGLLTVGNSDNKDYDRIFVKDHTTIANVSINSLKNAYNCIPDMRSSKISLGLAVDIKWSKGITVDVPID